VLDDVSGALTLGMEQHEKQREHRNCVVAVPSSSELQGFPSA